MNPATDVDKTKAQLIEELTMLRERLTAFEQGEGASGGFEVTVGRPAGRAFWESHDQFRLLADRVPGIIYQCRSDDRLTTLYVNSTVESLTGYSRDEFLGSAVSLADLCHPDDLGRILTTINLALARREPFEMTYRFKRKDGQWRWFHDIGVGVYRDGKLAFLEGFAHDITERKQMEEALRMSEDRLRRQVAELSYLYDASPVGLCLVDKNLRYMRVNQRLADINGRPVSEHPGRTPHEIIPELGRQIEPLCRRVVETGEPVLDQEMRGSTPADPGTERCWLASYCPVRSDDGSLVGVGMVVQDITEHRESERTLRRERNRAQRYLDIAGVIMLALSREGDIRLINRRGCEILGYEETQLVGRNWFETCLPPAARERVRSVFQRLMRGETQPVEYFENPVITAVGEERIIAWHNVLLTDDDGRITGTLSSGEDITERKQAEDALRASEENFRAVVDNANDGILIGLSDGVHVYANQHAAEITGYTVDELIGMHARDLADPDEWQELSQRMRSRFAGEDTENHYETAILRKDGLKGQIELTAAVTTWQGRPADLVIIRDVSARKVAEEELKRRARQQEQLLEVARALTASLDVEEVLRIIAQRSVELLGSHACAIFSLENDGKTLTPIVAPQSTQFRAFSAVPLNVDKSLTGWAVRAKKSMIFNDADRHPDGQLIPGIPEHVNKHVMVAPFLVHGEPIGAMWHLRKDTPFSHDDLALIDTFATYASTAFKNARIHRDLQEEVETRRRAEVTLRESEERLRAQFNGTPISTLVFRKRGSTFDLIDYNQANFELTRGGIVDFLHERAEKIYACRPDIRDHIERCHREKTTITLQTSYRMLTTGEDKEFILTFVFVPPDLVLLHSDDITTRRKVEVENQQAFEEIAHLKEELEKERDYLREEFNVALRYGEIVGESPALRRVLAQIEAVAGTNASALILGESGVGKELVARAIHAQSPRNPGPLVKVNCASIPRELFESEFFGHVKGAFTGAHRDRIGRFQLANGGTLFLDEVADIPPELQVKLLRVLQDGEFERVGEDTTRSVDVRVIAATNRDLRKEVSQGRFREDLYYRLSVFPIHVPPLRERRQDVLPLAVHFLKLACQDHERADLTLTRAQARALQEYDWPGNIRELQNIIERAVILSKGERLRLDLPLSSGGPAEAAAASVEKEERSAGFVSAAELRRRERENIVAALEAARWKVSGAGGAAELLGLKPSTLSYQMKVMGIRKPNRVVG